MGGPGKEEVKMRKGMVANLEAVRCGGLERSQIDCGLVGDGNLLETSVNGELRWIVSSGSVNEGPVLRSRVLLR